MRVEVINAGMPQANSDNMAAMIEREILGYKPDLITLYAGYNDAVYVVDETSMQRLSRWVHERVATYVALKAAIAALGGPVLHSKWATYIPRADRGYIEKQVRLHVDRYVANLERIGALAEKTSTRLLLITQPMTTAWGKDARLRKMPYEEELGRITEQLEQEGWVTAHEGAFLVHRALMRALEATARRDRRPLVDNISIVNDHPGYLASYVHLTEDGNQALAEALFEVIVPLVRRARM
jgi:lysophospholipase L1-like esterase